MAFVTPLFLPFETGDLSLPDGDVLFFNGEVPSGVDVSAWRARLTVVQPWRGQCNALKAAGFAAQPDAQELAKGGFAAALVTIGKHRGEAELAIGQAFDHVVDGGWVIAGGPKRSGAASLRKWMSGWADVELSFSKHHWQVFGVRKSGQKQKPDLAVPNQALHGFETAPGMFSHGAVDEGSQLLAHHLPDGISLGHLADFGCGWGYLSANWLPRSSASAVTLLDAHWPSLQAAKRNLKSHVPYADLPVETLWLDLASEKPPARYDTIVMNPPFHTGQKTDMELGTTFFERAAQHLKPGGALYAVANRHLPYEPVIAARFKRHETLSETSRFKVFKAIR